MTDTTLSPAWLPLANLSPAWLALADALVDVAAEEISSSVLHADYVPAAREHGWDPEQFELTSDDVDFLDGGQDHEISAPLRHIRDKCWRTHRILVLDVQRRVREILADAVAAELDAAEAAEPEPVAADLAERLLSEGIIADWADGSVYRMSETDESWCLARGAIADNLRDIEDSVHQILVDAAAEARAEWAAERAADAGGES